MRWEDERYVRLYTRDTSDWLSLSLGAQGLLALLLRKADRAGIIELGRHGKRSVAVLIGHAHRWQEIEPSLDELLEDGVIEMRGDLLVFRNYIEAQTAAQTDRVRKDESRSRARDLARARAQISTQGHGPSRDVTPMGEYGQAVTNRDQESQNVTKSHKSSQAVTGGHKRSPLAELSCAEPSRAELSRADSPPTPQGDDDPEVQAVAAFVADLPPVPGSLGVLAEAWNEITTAPLPRVAEMPPARRKQAQAALKRRPLEEWRRVFAAVEASSFCRGVDGGWRAGFDWTIRAGGVKPEPAIGLLEGVYARAGSSGGDVRRGVVRAEDALARMEPAGEVLL